MRDSVTVTIVTYNSALYIGPCLEAVLSQSRPPLEVIVVDNASSDATRSILRGFEPRVRVELNGRNTGFAAAQNQAIAAGSGDWVLTLNPDALLTPGFLETMVEAGAADASVGSVCGRLLSIGPGFVKRRETRFDSAGIYFTPSMRHFDRGWGEPDDGRYREREYVFGASGAAALYRREMIRDVSVGGEFFDTDFFAYREDADVAWRSQLQGWRCLYVPDAVAWHVRSVTPSRRGSLPPALNMHSVKNRILMRVKNATAGVYRRYWLSATARDLLVAAACLTCEHTSLPAFWHAARCLPAALRKRREILRRRRVDDDAIARWFSSHPASEGVPPAAAWPASAPLVRRAP